MLSNSSLIFLLTNFLFFNHYSWAYKGGRTPPPTCHSTSSAGSKVPAQKYKLQSEVNCLPTPTDTCTYGVCTAAKCTAAEGWCTDKYTEMPKSLGFDKNPTEVLNGYSPTASNVKVINLDRLGVDANGKALNIIGTYADPDKSSCPKPDGSGNYEVQGGETICDMGIIAGVYHTDLEDPVLSFITSFNRPVFAKCNYFDPSCGTCCTSWTPPVCCPPPPPPAKKK